MSTSDGNGVEVWFVRMSGRVRGPFSKTVLASMVERGRIQATTKISGDRREWTTADSVPGLFPNSCSEIPVTSAKPTVDEFSPKPDQAPKAGVCFFSVDGTVHGPVTRADIEARLQRGDLSPSDFVWIGGAGAWGPASNYFSTFPELPAEPVGSKIRRNRNSPLHVSLAAAVVLLIGLPTWIVVAKAVADRRDREKRQQLAYLKDKHFKGAAQKEKDREAVAEMAAAQKKREAAEKAEKQKAEKEKAADEQISKLLRERLERDARLAKELQAEDDILRLLKQSRTSSERKRVSELVKEHCFNPLVIRLAAFDAFKRGDNNEAIRLATECQRLAADVPADSPLFLSSDTKAEMIFLCAAAELADNKLGDAFRSLENATKLKSDYRGHLEAVKQAIDDISPSPECLALARDVTGDSTILNRNGLNIDIAGTIELQVRKTGIVEEMRVHIVKLLDDNSLIVKYQDPPSSETRLLMFPFKTVSRIFRGVESEAYVRVGLDDLGLDQLELQMRLGDGQGRGYIFYFLDSSDYLDPGYMEQRRRNPRNPSETRLSMFARGTEHVFGTRFYGHWCSLSGQIYREQGHYTVEDVIRKWHEFDASNKRYDVPFTWTRSYARVIAEGNRKQYASFLVSGQAAPFLNLPSRDRIPYKTKGADPIRDLLVGGLRFAGTIDTGVRRTQEMNKGLPSYQANTNLTIELAKIYIDMTPEQRREFLNSTFIAARAVQSIIRFVSQVELAPAPTQARHDLTRPTEKRQAIPFKVRFTIVSDGKPIAENSCIHVYRGGTDGDVGLPSAILGADKYFADKNGAIHLDVYSRGAHFVFRVGEKKSEYHRVREAGDVLVAVK